jgi:phage repressor protein C with HTH and peptisase S24 domain
MTDIETEIKKEQGRRLAELRSNLGKTQQDFSKEIGLDRAYLAQIEMGNKSLSYNTLMNVTYRYKNLNTNWLLQGHGEMFELENEVQHMSIIQKTNVDLYDMEAFAGLGINGDQTEVIKERWYIPDLVGDHVALYVKGNSMVPTVADGDIVIAKKVTNNREIESEKIYIIVMADGVVLKRLIFKRDHITLASDNPFFDSVEVSKEDIITLYRVVLYCCYG